MTGSAAVEDAAGAASSSSSSSSSLSLSSSPALQQQQPPPSLQQRFQELQVSVKSALQGDALNAWLRQQPAAVEVGVSMALGGLMGVLGGDLRNSMPTPPSAATGLTPDALSSLQQAQVCVRACLHFPPPTILDLFLFLFLEW